MNISRISCALFSLSLLVLSCQPAQDETNKADPAQALFEKNSTTVQAYLEAWQNESVDYDNSFAQDFWTWDTGFGGPDTLRLEDIKKRDQNNWARFDFEMVDAPFNLLPGVDVETKAMDGSVRYYGDWKVSSPASDSTEEKSGVIKIYGAFVFNDEGKVSLQLTYGDFGGIIGYLNSNE